MQDHTPQLPLLTIDADGNLQELPKIVPITQKQVKDLTGQIFGRLTVLGFVGVNDFKQATWLCQCKCGEIRINTRPNLVSGGAVSCGCFHREITAAISKTHGKSHTSEYRIWAGIKSRCSNTGIDSYKNYGGRGILMCKEWENSFDTFLRDMGPRPNPKATVERIDNNGEYSQANCRWASRTEQANNKRCNRIIAFRGEELTVSQWARKLNIPYGTLSSRISKLGWPAEKALTEPYGVQTLSYQGEELPVAEWAKRAGIHQRTLRSRLDAGWPIEKALTAPRLR